MRSLYLLVFTAGLVTLGMEISAARLLEPAFGNSQIVWSALIGLILLALAVGAWLGGMLADRYPRRRELHLALTAAGLAVALVPLVSQPVLRLAAIGLADFAPGVLAGALAAVTLLFALPAILLGTAAPWAVRIAVGEEERGLSMANEDAPHPNDPNILQPYYHSLGALAGRFSALATAGSLIGAFLPVLWLIPTLGTRWTFYLLALLLLAVVSVSALRTPYRWAPLAGLAAVLLLAFFTQPAGVRAAWDDGRAGTLIYEDESQFNYIAVRQWGSERHLKLNEGIGIHSVYHPDAQLSQGIWDYFLLAPLFRRGEGRGAEREGNGQLSTAEAAGAHMGLDSPVSNLLLIGAAAGTVPGLYTDIYGAAPITGVELDPQIVRVGQEYFGATWPNYTAVAADGRQWLARQGSDVKFDVIAVDAYRPPYIPFHLTTVEFFELVRHHLDEDGVLAINVGRTPTNNALVDALAVTLAVVFPTVLVVDEPGPPDTLANSLVVATMQPATIEAFRARVKGLSAELPVEFREFAARTVAQARVAAPAPNAPIFTDDKSPVEQVVHGVIADFVLRRVPAAP